MVGSYWVCHWKKSFWVGSCDGIGCLAYLLFCAAYWSRQPRVFRRLSRSCLNCILHPHPYPQQDQWVKSLKKGGFKHPSENLIDRSSTTIALALTVFSQLLPILGFHTDLDSRVSASSHTFKGAMNKEHHQCHLREKEPMAWHIKILLFSSIYKMWYFAQ